MPDEAPAAAESADLTRPGIIEASAGTGKTFTIGQIYLALLRGEKTYSRSDGNASRTPGVPVGADGRRAALRVREILVVTFTEAATAELRARLRGNIRAALADVPAEDAAVRDALRLADAEFDEAAVFTIHGFCSRVLKEFGLAPLKKEIVPDAGDELRRFAARWRAAKIAAGDEAFFGVSADDAAKVVALFLKNPKIVPIPPRDAKDARGNALFRVAKEAVPEWLALRRNARDLSYDEMLSTLLDALERDAELAAKIAARFKFALVDEFQDTDPVQWEIFRRVFLACGKPIFCVGDPKQAIYEFRGGDVRTYRKAREEILRESGGNSLRLRENFRSSPPLIAALNELFAADARICGTLDFGTKKNPRLIEIAAAGLLDYAPAKFPRAKAESPDAEDENLPAAVLRTAMGTDKARLRQDGATRIFANDIRDLIENRGVAPQEIAVLTGSNEEANAFRRELSRRGIPVATTSRGNVLRHPVAQALADVLRAVLAPQDAAVFRRALLTPFFAARGEKILLAQDAAEETGTLRRAFAEARDAWERKGFLPAFFSLADKLGFFGALAESDAAEELTTHTLHLAELIHAREDRANSSPRAVLETFEQMLAAAEDDDGSEEFQLRAESDDAAVRVLTVHKSKGLQFDIVFVPSLWAKTVGVKADFAKRAGTDGGTELIFGAGTEKSDDFLRAKAETEIENAACLFYVALTRARRRVVLFHGVQNVLRAARGNWISYQKLLLRAAGATADDARERLPHWRRVAANAPLPEDVFPPRANASERAAAGTPPPLMTLERAERRFARAENALERLRRSPDGIFSFSSLAAHAEKNAAVPGRENDERVFAGVPEAATPEFSAGARADEKAFPKKNFSDLPAGAEFGTIAHAVFEKVDFRSRENLPALLDENLPRLPGWAKKSAEEKKSVREKFSALVAANLALPLPPDGLRLETLDAGNFIRETEFHFPLRRSKNFYAELFRIFTDWGGVYAETAARHWTPDGNAAGGAPGIGGMMDGVIDLAFRADGRYFILDWKTNAVVPAGNVPAGFRLPEAAIRREIVERAYALQWSIYAVALKRFLTGTLGKNYVHDRDFGGVVYLFVRWLAPFSDAGTLSSARLSALEELLCDG